MVIALPVAMDIYVPAVPHIAHLFHVTAGRMQLTLTLFMLTAGIMQLIVGPLSDQLGRKKMSLFAILFFIAGTLLCSSAHSATQLILYRSVQAIGACGMLVIAFAMVRDVFHGARSAKAYSYLNGIISFSPMFAPFIGSYLDVRYGWPTTFLALLLIAAVALITVCFVMPETLPLHRRVTMDRGIFKVYKNIATNGIFSIYTLSAAIGLSYLYIFCSISPYIIIRQLHIPELDYGYYFFFMGISFFIGSFLSGYIVGRIGVYKAVLIGFCITLVGGLWMTVWYLVTGLSINNFIWPMLLIGIGATFCMGAGTGGSMEPFTEQVGAAAALGGAIRFLFSALVGSLLITSTVSSTLPLAIPAIVFSILGATVFLALRRKLEFHGNH